MRIARRSGGLERSGRWIGRCVQLAGGAGMRMTATDVGNRTQAEWETLDPGLDTSKD